MKTPTEGQLEEFLRLEEHLLNPQMIRFKIPDGTFTVKCDASDGKLRAAALHTQDNSKFYPIGYSSRTLCRTIHSDLRTIF